MKKIKYKIKNKKKTTTTRYCFDLDYNKIIKQKRKRY